MRAVVFTAEGELALEERPRPTPGYKEILIETAAVGICGTDTHVLDGEFEGTVFPLVPTLSTRTFASGRAASSRASTRET